MSAASLPLLREEVTLSGGPQLLPMNKLGPREISPGVVTFGLLLPWVSDVDGNRISVKILHEKDQFLQDIQPNEYFLTHSTDPVYGDYWSTTALSIDISQRKNFRSSWGTPGTYIYRYQIYPPGNAAPIDWVIDPYAREYGTGKMSAFTLGYEEYQWNPKEASWKTPKLNDLIVYELMLSEFGGSIDGAIEHLPYLADLGINCIEVMPIDNVAETIDWGYIPMGYFGVDERFGNRKDFQRFVDAAHQNGIAVILDSVYGHTASDFPYQYVYDKLHYNENPFMGPFAKDMFGCSTNFNRQLTRDFFHTVNQHWLQVYHVDGFRYDCVPNYWDGATGNGYASLTYWTYQATKAKLADNSPYWSRFAGSTSINIIQCAEQLEAPIDILNQTYSNATWQNETMASAAALAQDSTANPPAWNNVARLGFTLGLQGYPSSVTVNNDSIAKAAFQHLENHDSSRFLANLGLQSSTENQLFAQGNRALWYRLQPYILALATAKGIPLLWQGQEFGENYTVPPDGIGRILIFRPVHWDYFYDEPGQNLIHLYRKALALRKNNEQFRAGDHYFYNHWDNFQSKGLLLFSRSTYDRLSLVALNFSNTDQTVAFRFPRAGNYTELLHGQDNKTGTSTDTDQQLFIPSNYGRIWDLNS